MASAFFIVAASCKQNEHVPPDNRGEVVNDTVPVPRQAPRGDAAELIRQCGKPDKDFIENEYEQETRHLVYRKQNVELTFSRAGEPSWVRVGVFPATGPERDEYMEPDELVRKLPCANGDLPKSKPTENSGVAGQRKSQVQTAPESKAASSMRDAAPHATAGAEPHAMTDADQRLEWRGAAVTLPATDPAADPDSRRLDDSEIQAALAAQGGSVRECVATSANGTDLHTTITVHFIVAGSGIVGKSRVRAPHVLFERGLLDCIQSATGRLTFPATGEATLVTLPINLSP